MKTLSLLFVVVLAQLAAATPIRFIHKGVSSGKLNGVSFPASQFTIDGVAETDSGVVCESEEGVPVCFAFPHQSATVTVDGLGTFAFVSETGTYARTSPGMVGLFRGDVRTGSTVSQGPHSESLRTWDRLSSIGPIQGNARFFGWDASGGRPPIFVDAGVFHFDSTPLLFPATFEAIVESTAMPGDTDGDGVVDLQDLNNVRNNFGDVGLGDTAPFDGIVDLEDLNAVRNNFGARAANAVPEPSTIALLALGAVGIALIGCGKAKNVP